MHAEAQLFKVTCTLRTGNDLTYIVVHNPLQPFIIVYHTVWSGTILLGMSYIGPSEVVLVLKWYLHKKSLVTDSGGHLSDGDLKAMIPKELHQESHSLHLVSAGACGQGQQLMTKTDPKYWLAITLSNQTFEVFYCNFARLGITRSIAQKQAVII